jgi:hypothetical protein
MSRGNDQGSGSCTGKAKLFDKFLGTQDNCRSPNETQRPYYAEQ